MVHEQSIKESVESHRTGEVSDSEALLRAYKAENKSLKKLLWGLVVGVFFVGILLGGGVSLWILNQRNSSLADGQQAVSQQIAADDEAVVSVPQEEEVIVTLDSDTLKADAMETKEMEDTEGAEETTEMEETEDALAAAPARGSADEGDAALEKEVAGQSSHEKEVAEQSSHEKEAANQSSHEKKTVEQSSHEKKVADQSSHEKEAKTKADSSSESASTKPVRLSEDVSYQIVGTIESHTIKRGDTLAKLARKYYGNKKIWPYIVKHNQKVIKDPNNVPIGTTLKIPRLAPETAGR